MGRRAVRLLVRTRAEDHSTSTSTRSRSRKPRAQAVDFSTPYYTNPQGIIVAANGPYAHATSLAAFKNASIGVQIGTTSLAAVTAEIKPSNQPDVFNTSNDVVQAFKIHRVDAIVVDLATAFDLTSTNLPHTTIAGQFSAPGGDNWGLLLSKGSALTPCVDKAVNALQADGTLAALNKRWIASEASVPGPALSRHGELSERGSAADHPRGPPARPTPARAALDRDRDGVDGRRDRRPGDLRADQPGLAERPRVLPQRPLVQPVVRAGAARLLARRASCS